LVNATSSAAARPVASRAKAKRRLRSMARMIPLR
jgi:hypothetical protein